MEASFEVYASEVPATSWFIVASWPNGRHEEPVGNFAQKAFAEFWISYVSPIWLQLRNAELE